MVTICTASLTFNNSTFCPHSVFMCFVWISEQTAIISLYNINWLVCITQTQCVYFAVRTGCLYIIQVICFVWITEQTAIISLYNTNWLVCITQTQSVYCAVRTGFLYIHSTFISVEHANEQFQLTVTLPAVFRTVWAPNLQVRRPNVAVCVAKPQTAFPSVIVRSSLKLDRYLSPLCLYASLMLIGSVRTSDV